MFVVEDLEGEERRDRPSACHVEVIDAEDDTGQLPPFLQPAPPASEEKVVPTRGSRDVSGEDVQRAQGVLVLGLHVVYLVGQLVRDRLSQQRGQQEVLHRVQGGRLVQTAFIVILFLEDVFSAMHRRNR